MSGLININIHTSYITSHLYEFKEIINLVMESHRKYEESKKLNIQVDPWDNYLYYDSKFFFDFIFSSSLGSLGKSRENIKQLLTYENAEEKFVLLKFVLLVYHNDLMPNFKLDGKTVSIKLVDYINKITVDDKETFVNKFIRKVLTLKEEPTEEEVDKFETKLETLFDLFIQDLKTKRQFSEVKEDYFKI